MCVGGGVNIEVHCTLAGEGGEEEGGGGRRREEGEGTKHGGWTNRDREMYTCACVCFLCVCMQEGYVHVDV